jgi:hypothetical protein
VVIGEDQAVARDEGAGAAGLQPDGGFAHAVEPCGIDRHAVFFGDGGARRIVEGPHAFFGGSRKGRERGKRRNRNELHRELQ